MAAKRPLGRQRGNIEERGGALRVRLYAGTDPVTGRQQRSAASSVTLACAIDEWLRTNEIETSTSKTYVGYVGNHIRPAIGAVALKKIDVRSLKTFYMELRRCLERVGVAIAGVDAGCERASLTNA